MKKKINPLLTLALIIAAAGISGAVVWRYSAAIKAPVPSGSQAVGPSSSVNPESTSNQPTPQASQVTQANPNLDTTSVADTKDWKTYTNAQYGFELKYPNKDTIEPQQSPDKDIDFGIIIGDNTGDNIIVTVSKIEKGRPNNAAPLSEEQGTLRSISHKDVKINGYGYRQYRYDNGGEVYVTEDYGYQYYIDSLASANNDNTLLSTIVSTFMIIH